MRVLLVFEGIKTVIDDLDALQKKAADNLQKQTEKLSDASQESWRTDTPVRSGRLQKGDKATPGKLSFELQNPVYYYKFVDEGHNTPKMFHGRPARRITHVAGKEMTTHVIQFILKNILDYLAKFLDFN